MILIRFVINIIFSLNMKNVETLKTVLTIVKYVVTALLGFLTGEIL